MSPNWCACRLDVIGTVEDIKRFILLVQHQESDAEKLLRLVAGNKLKDNDLFSFERIVPCDDVPESQWYETHCARWGTKWDACDVECDVDSCIDDESVWFRFETAWSPPIPIIDRLHELFPAMSFTLEYEEPGVGFAGTYSATPDGISDETYDAKQYNEDGDEVEPV